MPWELPGKLQEERRLENYEPVRQTAFEPAFAHQTVRLKGTHLKLLKSLRESETVCVPKRSHCSPMRLLGEDPGLGKRAGE